MAGTRPVTSSEKLSAPSTLAPGAPQYATPGDKPKATRKDSALKSSATAGSEKKHRRRHKEKSTETENEAESKSRKSSKSSRKNQEAEAVTESQADVSPQAVAEPISPAASATTSVNTATSSTVDPTPTATATVIAPPLTPPPPKWDPTDLERAVAALSKAQSEKAVLEQQEAKTKKALEEYDSIMQTLEADRKKAIQRAQDAESKQAQLEKALQTLRDEFDAHKEDASLAIEKKEQLLRSHQVQIDELEGELKKAAEKYQTAQSQISTLEDYLQKVKDQLPLLEAQLAAAENAREEAELALEQSKLEHQNQLEISARQSEEASEDIVPEKPRPRTRTEKAKAFGRALLSAMPYVLFGIAVACAIAFGLMFWQVTIPVVGVFLAQAIGQTLTAVVYAAVLAPIVASLALGVDKFFNWAFKSKETPAPSNPSSRDMVDDYLEATEDQQLSSSAKLQTAFSAANKTKATTTTTTTDTRPVYKLEVVEEKKSVGQRVLAFFGKKEKPKTDAPNIGNVNSAYSSPAPVYASPTVSVH